MELLTIEEVQAAGLGTGKEPADLRELIDREEGRLRRWIGPLSGAITQKWWLSAGHHLFLNRPAATITSLTDYGVLVPALDYELRGRRIVSLGRDWIGPTVAVYTPSDTDAVKAALLELIELRLAGDPLKISESGNDYSYSRAEAPANLRQRIIAELLPTRGLG